MIDGKLFIREGKEDCQLGFSCPKCNAWHVAWVSERAPHQNDDMVNVWQFRWIAGNVIELQPSWDNSTDCGFHSTNPWRVRLAP